MNILTILKELFLQQILYPKKVKITIRNSNRQKVCRHVSYHAYIPLLKFNNIVMDKIIKILSSIICFFFFVIYEFIDYLNVFLFFLPNLPESFVTEKKWEKILRKLIKKIITL